MRIGIRLSKSESEVQGCTSRIGKFRVHWYYACTGVMVVMVMAMAMVVMVVMIVVISSGADVCCHGDVGLRWW